MDWLGTFPPDRRPTAKSGTRAHAGLVVGRYILLWNVLVAHVSDDPLRPYSSSIGLSAFTVANCSGRVVPSALQLVIVSTGRSIRSQCGTGSAALMGHVRMGALRGNRPAVECVGLFAGI